MTRDRTSYSRRSILKRGAITTGALVLGGTAGSGTAAAGLGNGRVGHYPLNNLKGSGKVKDRVHDASPYRNDGTNYGASVVRGGGKVGNAFEFDGDSSYVRVDHDVSLNAASITVATWLKFTDNAEYHFFLSKRSDSGGGEYQMYYRCVDSGPGKTMAYWDGNTIYDGELYLEKDTWHHLTWVVDQDGFRGYHNGSEAVAIAGATTPSDGQSPVYIGTDNVGNYATGMVDEVRIYDRALSESEIEALASMGGG